MGEECWYLRTQTETFGPESREKMLEWARLGRIMPGQEITSDNLVWRRVEDVPFLDMRFSIDIGDGTPRGPFNRVAAEALLASGRLPAESKLVEVRDPFPPEDEPAPADDAQAELTDDEQIESTAEEAAEPVVGETGEVTNASADEAEDALVDETENSSVVESTDSVSAEELAETPVEELAEMPVEELAETPVEELAETPVEELAEMPVEELAETPVEKVVEKVVEVPVERIVEKIVVDETRVKELEALLGEERRHTAELQGHLDESLRKFSEASLVAKEQENALRAEVAAVRNQVVTYENALKDAADRENKFTEQIRALEDELRRLPQAASEVADIQAAVFAVISDESKEIERELDLEKAEFEAVRKRYAERADRLQERRRELLRRSGANIEDMTRRALLSRPEDPRTARLRSDLEELRRTHERSMLDRGDKIRILSEQVRRLEDDRKRWAEGQKDVTQLQTEVQMLRELVQTREKELLEERQRNEALVIRHADEQQTLLARLASLESPLVGNSAAPSTYQGREGRKVKLAGWMSFK